MKTEGKSTILVYYVKPIRKKSLAAGYSVTLRMKKIKAEVKQTTQTDIK
jgi:hypothetical protein